jgi:uncharacterized protein with GYD domain
VVVSLIFIVLTKVKKSPAMDKEFVDKWTQKLPEMEKQGIKVKTYWTLGRYDGVSIVEAPSEKDVLKMLMPLFDTVHTETLVAIPREEAVKLI